MSTSEGFTHDKLLLSNVNKILKEGIINLHNRRDMLNVEEKSRLLLELIKVVYSCLSVMTIEDEKEFSSLQSCYIMLDDLYANNSSDASESGAGVVLMPEMSVNNNQHADSSYYDSSDDDIAMVKPFKNIAAKPEEAFSIMSSNSRYTQDTSKGNEDDYNRRIKRNRVSLSQHMINEYADELDQQNKSSLPNQPANEEDNKNKNEKGKEPVKLDQVKDT